MSKFVYDLAEGGAHMKKLSVRPMETVKTTAALYGGLPCRPVFKLA